MVFSKEENYARRQLLQRRLPISGRTQPQGRQIAQKITQKLLREFVSKLSTKKYKRHSRPLRGRLLLQRAVGALGCFSVDKEETTIYKGNAFQQAIFELYPIVSAVARSVVVKQALHLCAKPAGVPRNRCRQHPSLSRISVLTPNLSFNPEPHPNEMGSKE